MADDVSSSALPILRRMLVTDRRRPKVVQSVFRGPATVVSQIKIDEAKLSTNNYIRLWNWKLSYIFPCEKVFTRSQSKNKYFTTRAITTQARHDCEKIAITGLEPASQDRSS